MARQLDIRLTGVAAALDALRTQVERAAEWSRRTGDVAIALGTARGDGPLNLAGTAVACRAVIPRWYARHADAGRAWLGVGEAVEASAGDAGTLADLAPVMDRWRPRVVAEDPSAVRWLGGAAFDAGPRRAAWRGWPRAKMWLPRVTFSQRGDRWTITVAAVVRPGQSAIDAWADAAQWCEAHLRSEAPVESTPYARRGAGAGSDAGAENRAGVLREAGGLRDEGVLREAGRRVEGLAAPDARRRWERLVTQTAGMLRAGRLEKVVLAREEVAPLPNPDVGAALDRLARWYPASTVFAVWHEDSCFLGATPERLVSVRAGEVAADCLAGTAPRGETPEEDERIARWLLTSRKNLHEHAVVREWLRDRLAPLCEALTIAPEPALKRLANVQHLYTPITGRLGGGTGILAVASALLPTPALAGSPQQEAMAYIRAVEGFDRGWYGGAVGWAGWDGDGAFSVAIRCALLRGGMAHLYAGAGIVADSDPAAEWEETVLKLRPMRHALLWREGDLDDGES